MSRVDIKNNKEELQPYDEVRIEEAIKNIIYDTTDYDSILSETGYKISKKKITLENITLIFKKVLKEELGIE